MAHTPTITEIEVIPVAGRDGMLMNLSGAHAPYFTRNVVLVHDSSGHTGVGEVPGGEGIRQALEDSKAVLIGQPIGQHLNCCSACSKPWRAATAVAGACRLLTCASPSMP